ncbi:MAG: hypothetical protein SOW25_06275 [Helicobacter sp.]|nr:hypothetical protein [Helicobacteraceae bacterium]MDY3113917.1 hypothetical protein [Helicobacter sp.]
MFRKVFKILGIIIVVLVLVIGSTLAWLFSNSGNEFLKNKITQIANQKAPIGLEFTHFKLGFSEYAFALTDKQKSQIALKGEYSLFTLNTKASVNALIKDLSLYEKLINFRLNGGIGLNGNIEKSGSNLSVKADIDAFNSKILADVNLENYSPKRLFIKSNNGISLESLLYFLNQPQYAKGRILLNADMDISNLSAPSGGFKILSSSITPNFALLKKEFSLTLPQDSIKLAIDGSVRQDEIIATILASSSYLNIASKDLKTSIKDFSINGILDLGIKNIAFNTFKLTTPLNANLALKATNITNQNATLSLNLFNNPILLNAEIPHFTPTKATLEAKDLSLKEVLNFANNYTSLSNIKAEGGISLEAAVDKINLAKAAYTLKGKLNSSILNLNINQMQLAKNNYLNADFSGDNQAILATLKSDLFDSKTNAEAAVKNYALDSIRLDMANLNLQKLAKLLGYEAQGLANAKANLKNFKDSNFDGDFSLESSKILLSKATLNKLSGLDFKNDLDLKLSSNGRLKKGSGEAELKISGDSLNADFTNVKIDIAKNAYSSDFNISTKDIAKINPLKTTLKGALTLKGNAGFKDNKPSIFVENNDFGNLSLSLKNEKLLISGKDLSVKKIADFTNNGKLVKGGILNLNTDLSIKDKDLIKNLNGFVNLSARNLEIYSIDIDGISKNYESANNVNLLDIGAFVLAGPLGIAATKGKDLGLLGVNSMVNTTSVIKEMQADFTLKNGVATAKDVAFATNKTRIAAKGGINLNNNAFKDFNIAILDEKNCAKYSQSIAGTLDSPKIQITQTTINTALNLATSLIGKFTKGAQKIAEPLTGQNTQCKPFYNGVVKHPK